MKPLEQLTVVPVSSITRGKRYRFAWFMGWLVSLLMSIGGAFLMGHIVAYDKAMKDISDARKEIESLQKQQTKVTEALVKAWEDQREGINLVSSWAEYIKDRDDIMVQNKNNPLRPVMSSLKH